MRVAAGVAGTFGTITLLSASAPAAAQSLPADPGESPLDARYQPGADSLPREGVPRGELLSFRMMGSRIYPGTSRTITVYVPAQYSGSCPACLYVGLDGLWFEAPTVFDNLIAKGEMPVTIAVGVAPGAVPGRFASNPRYNRSAEFDAVDGTLGRFILEEVLPRVRALRTATGVPLRISDNPNDRMIGGASTGAIGAFNFAFKRPDAFRRVFSAIGTYVGMRGGDQLAVLVRKTEPQPLRIYLEDGLHDQLIEFIGEVGDWALANQTMASALKFAGYEVREDWGQGTHSLRHATAIFPDAMRWLWRDWPAPVRAGRSLNVMLRDVLISDQGWTAVSGIEGRELVPAPGGRVLIRDGAGHLVELSRAGRPRRLDRPRLRTALLAADHDGPIFQAGGFVMLGGRKRIPLPPGKRLSAFILDDRGNGYATVAEDGTLWLVRSGAAPLRLDGGLRSPTGLVRSADGAWLAVSESGSRHGVSYRIGGDGRVLDRQSFYWFHSPDDADNSGATQLATDIEGRIYAATRLGIQILDRNGRSRAILPLPGGLSKGVAFGGAGNCRLYALGGNGQIYWRPVKVAGASSADTPIQLPEWTAA